MKTLPLSLLATTLAAPLTAPAETVVFHDTFGSGSTLNSASPANPDATSTGYQLLSGKSWSGQGITAERLRIGMVATSSGIMECQALFTTNPVTLDAEYDAIELRITFTNTAGLLGGGNMTLGFGLYNSGGLNGSVKPVPGGLNGTLANTASGAATGNAQGWKGYFGQLFYSGGNHRIANRDAQTGSNNQNQGTATSGTGSSPANPAPASVSANVLSDLTLAVGATYTDVLTITRRGDGDLAITNTLYAGPEPGGAVLASVGGITTNTTYLTSSFDSLAIGYRANAATTMDVSRITVTKYTQADLPALYNVQLNGWTNNTFSGAARIGAAGDLWNNPDWTGIYTGSTNLITGATLLDSTGADLGVTFTMTAAYNNNTTDWNTGIFNHYTGQTAGSATPVLMDQVVKVDYSGSVNVMTLTLSGLPPNQLVTAYVYGAGNGGGQGAQWSFAATNGGGQVHTVYDGSATGRDVTRHSSKGLSWETLAGTTDGSGNLTITATAGNGSVWWQTYLNGLQLQVGGTAPTITGLAHQTVEDGATVLLSPVVSGNPTPTYQWYENGASLPGETNTTLTLTSVTTNQSGYVYSLVAENAIGSASNSMTLTVTPSVYSTMSVTAVSPGNGAAGVCPDTPLTVSFSDAVSLGSIGAIRVFHVTNPATPVDTIYVADGLVQQRYFPGDGQRFSYPTISISGNTVKINPHFNVLAPNQTYYVTMDPKTFLDSGGTNFVGLTDTNAWMFTTQPGPADPNNIVVNAAGTGDFLTVQGAVNSVPGGSTTPTLIQVRDGLYREIVNISGRHNITLRGQSRAGTLVGFPNNANYQAANGGTTHARMSFKVNANDIALESLTLTNMTPQGGSQAEALMIETGARRCIVFNADVVSRQDTILANYHTSQAYFRQSTIRGNYDYIWGGGNVYFDDCTIHTLAGVGGPNLTAARTTTQATSDATFPWLNPGGTYTANGLSFVGCTFTADGGVGNITLAGNNGTAGNLVSWALCRFQGNHVTPAASLFSGNYLFWQHGNTDLSSNPVSFPTLTTLPGGDARLQAATNVTAWLYGWTPQLLPNILQQPASTNVLAGSPVTLTVSATGIPDPTYQWKHAGTNLVGETGAILLLASAQAEDAGEYVVEVSNAAGTVTSGVATLTVTPAVPPTLSNPTILPGGAFQFSFSGESGQPYRVWASEDVALTPVVDTWTLLTNGVFGVAPEGFTDGETPGLPRRFYLITVP